MLVAVAVIALFGTWLFHALLGAATGHAMGVISFLLYLVGAGLLFAAGFLTASVSWGLGAAVQWAPLRK
ncbi:hypothetical protein AB0O50_19355 [Streptomyces cyaneofuscatus]|uniref:hypothetical protein n=1 Tax=Streptomyces cyaneofuscatus TaxID=66883 RepID=UPI003422CD92